MIAGSVLAALLALGPSPVEGAQPGYAWRLPAGFPRPAAPADNPMSEAKVELGRRLFYDTRLSANGTQSCASCHRQELAFSDGRARAVGSTGEVHRRNAMSLTNVAYSTALTWADPTIGSLEEQALVPMLGDRPVELGLDRAGTELAARLQGDPWYRAAFREAFPDDAAPFTLEHVAAALACFERTLVSGDSPYDRLVYQGRMDALSESAWRGMRLYHSKRLACSRCHAGINFSGPIAYEGAAGTTRPEFENTGLAGPSGDPGLGAVTHRRADAGRFQVPTLRNVALTAPYMHDGSLRSLEEVVDHYATLGDGAHRTGRTSRILAGFRLSPEEKHDLVEFLLSLTDETFVRDRRFADPWRSP